MPDKIAVIKTGGKQYKVKEGDIIKIEKINAKDGAKIKFDTLLISSFDGQKLEIGQPYLEKKVEGKLIGQGKDKKVTVIKYKRKTRYKRTLGHRQLFSKVEIVSVA